MTEGALVSATEATQLALIQQTDNVYLNITQSAADLQRLRKNAGSRGIDSAIPVSVILDDGTELRPQRQAAVLRRDRRPDQRPGHPARPGRRTRTTPCCRASTCACAWRRPQLPSGILVPQQAVTRGGQTGDTVMVVGADNKPTPRTVKIASQEGANWVITDGLKEGEQVMVDGFQKLQMLPPGTPVQPVPVERRASAAADGAARRPAAPPPANATPPRRAAEMQQQQDLLWPSFFIDRPIFAWVIALFIMVLGGVAITQLPVAQYPTVAPPSIVVSVAYPGASAQTLEDSVISVIEHEMNGSPGMIYMESTSQANGTGSITISLRARHRPRPGPGRRPEPPVARGPAPAGGRDPAGRARRQGPLQLPAVHHPVVGRPELGPDRAGRLRVAQRAARDPAHPGRRPGPAVRHREARCASGSIRPSWSASA